MPNYEKIVLSPIEATAYWWVNLIRSKVREISIYGSSDKKEIKFSKIFYDYTEIEWRKVYLKLVKAIAKDVQSFVPDDNSDSFSQDTEIKGHTRLNDEISKIIGKRVPDIRLAGNNVKDSVIYTTSSSASVWYKSCGEDKLSLKYDPSYILTGDKDSLDFYNLLIATIAIIKNIDRSSKSVSILRERFCNEYVNLSESEINLNDVIEMFNFAFDKACDNDLIMGHSSEKVYFTSFRNIDYVGLEPYLDLAGHYANAVLQETKDNDENAFSKKLKK